MKKIFATLVFFACSLTATAQQDNIDQLQQEPPRETQRQVERSAARDAQRAEAERKQKEAEAEKIKVQAQNEAERKKAHLESNEKNIFKQKSKNK